MLRRLSCLATAVIALVAALPAPASAATSACLPGGVTRCQVWTGKVVRVSDGDTLMVDLAGDGTSEPRSIRLIDAQAMELSVHSSIVAKRRGDCHALEATARLEQLVRAGGGVVRLTAQDASSSSLNRPLRAVQLRIGGVWRDAGLELVRQGFALWQPFAGEWAWNSAYRAGTRSAAHAGLNLFDTDACGSGPYQSEPISVTVDWKQELVHLTNGAAYPISLAGWWVRDSGLRRYTFPPRTMVHPGAIITVHVFAGTTTATDFFWGLDAPVFDNPTGDEQDRGDGGYLFDPQGDLRAWMIYPAG
ncbi:lamin tail domain-containing protein [Actinoplanes sp. TFC3]|uniref:lamin tail domain-containing protein n=1 Tax=Actinoplanes sp. TFC3 TaxID=1710355 RepID=UPI001F3C8097|nr:lamin tail domain-containing protein [Actinoplanes sp. TFC3]